MANYTTNSGFADLVGSMTVTNDNVDSYTSDTQGSGTVRNLGGTALNFNVTFPSVNRTYHVQARADGSNYSGTASNNSPIAAQEEWTATASTGGTADAARAGAGYGSPAADDETKKSAS